MREYDNIKPLRLFKAIGDFIRNQILAILECRIHRIANDNGPLPDKLNDAKHDGNNDSTINNQSNNLFCFTLFNFFRFCFSIRINFFTHLFYSCGNSNVSRPSLPERKSSIKSFEALSKSRVFPFWRQFLTSAMPSNTAILSQFSLTAYLSSKIPG